MTKFYSQFGQDVLLNEIFKDNNDGFFVEVGCLDGRQVSNTLTFEERGWKGLCIEAQSDFISYLKKNRPNSIICHCAAGDSNEDNVPFYANRLGCCSSLDSSREDNFCKLYSKIFFGYEKQVVNRRRLDYLFKKYEITSIDILSIDVEGTELDVLKGIDFNNYKPRILLIEAGTREIRKNLYKFLKQYGYRKSVYIELDTFFVIYKKDHKKIFNKRFKAILNHTKNPFSEGIDFKKEVIIDTTLQFYVRNRISGIIKDIRFKCNFILGKMGISFKLDKKKK